MSQENLHKDPASEQKELNEESFLKELYTFMKTRGTPIERIPHLGFKQIDLFLMYKTVQNFGGYNQVTAHQQWKQVYNELGGNPRSTSAATCTRRHYEKLILPFECHLRGESEKVMPVTRPLKRSRFSNFANEDEARGGKRYTSYGLQHASPAQDVHDYLEDSHMRIIPVPAHFRQYFPQEHPPLATYHPSASMCQPPKPQHPQQVTHLPTNQEHNEWPKKQLVLLRNLAKEYISSSGWAEPLNLSRKESGLDPLSQQPSSFTPTSSGNKTPRFLNKVFPLYPALNVAKDEGLEGLQNETNATVSSPGHSPQVGQQQTVIDLSSTSSLSTPLTTVSDVHVSAFDNLSLQTLSTLDGVRQNILEGSSPQLKEAEKPLKPPVNPPTMSYPQLASQKEPADKMEIQIPLTVLQDLLKGKFGMGSQHYPQNLVPQLDKSSVGIGEARGERRKNMKALHPEHGTSDLSFQDPTRARKGIVNEMNHKNVYLEKRNPSSLAATKDSLFCSHDNDSFRVSLDIKAPDWKSLPQCSSKFSQLNMAINNSTHSTAYQHVYTQDRDFVAQTTETMRNIQMQDLMLDRAHDRVHSAPIMLYPRPRVQDPRKNGPPETGCCTGTPQSRAPLSRQLHEVSMVMSEKRLMADSPTMLMVNSATPSLVPLTPEEYIKLRRLISSSP